MIWNGKDLLSYPHDMNHPGEACQKVQFISTEFPFIFTWKDGGIFVGKLGRNKQFSNSSLLEHTIHNY